MQRRKPFLPVAGLVLLAACSRPPSHAFTTQGSTTPESTTTSAPAAPDQPIAISGRGFELLAVAPVGEAASDAAWAGVLDTLNRYLQSAVLIPLRSGGPAGDLAPFFTTLVADRIGTAGPDRAAFIDEGFAPAADIRSEAAVATLTALAGDDGVMSVVSADLDLRLTGRVDGAPLTVLRTGELVLLPEGGIWRIDAWDLKVTRTLAKAATTTTARS